jgi:hypothetical protein
MFPIIKIQYPNNCEFLKLLKHVEKLKATNPNTLFVFTGKSLSCIEEYNYLEKLFKTVDIKLYWQEAPMQFSQEASVDTIYSTLLAA